MSSLTPLTYHEAYENAMNGIPVRHSSWPEGEFIVGAVVNEKGQVIEVENFPVDMPEDWEFQETEGSKLFATLDAMNDRQQQFFIDAALASPQTKIGALIHSLIQEKYTLKSRLGVVNQNDDLVPDLKNQVQCLMREAEASRKATEALIEELVTDPGRYAVMKQWVETRRQARERGIPINEVLTECYRKSDPNVPHA